MVDLIEVILKVEPNLVKETLSRIGIMNKRDKILYPSCYLYESDSKFFIVHFKELFLLRSDSYCYSDFSEDDLTRKLSIIKLLEKWDMILPVELCEFETSYISVLAHKEKSSWRIVHKFNFATLTD